MTISRDGKMLGVLWKQIQFLDPNTGKEVAQALPVDTDMFAKT